MSRDASIHVRLLFGGIAALIVGSYAAISGTSTSLERDASTGWPKVMGDITSSKVVEYIETTRGGDKRTRFRVEAVYGYAVGETVHVGTRITWSDPRFDLRTAAQDWRDTFAPLGPMGVYYDPANPKKAVLHAGAGSSHGFIAYMGLMLIGVGAGATLFSTPYGRRNPGSAVLIAAAILGVALLAFLLVTL